ncbi:glycoside hydrolase family 28 protein [Laetiporus sulphureus 93-53]|uniref:galacturonan 1,4-alpha-galacturonidase n=1 Tax=Laetiporus sulphureus 93-53 TaxID=1314785 RepID=A0A165CYH7_9APHY|nr:glycoside hydrolase family 28 protein [Laetiporus sulphureus 93-53]KZT03751.1 glycoside hydrolase family 28 protein [Laetiporus sulphureus 93-53]
MLFAFSLAAFALAWDKVCVVEPLGGGRDDGPSINDAFSECSSNAAVILYSYYSVNTLLKTEGLKNVDIVLSGTVQYTPNIAYWSPNSLYMTYQNATTFWFLSGDNIHLYGGGTIDGNGQVWWDEYAISGDSGTAGGSSTTFARPVPLTVGNASNVVIENITEISSPFWIVYQSTNVRNDLEFSTTASNRVGSAGSDGWDIYRSSYVTITDSTVNNDDDCVSFKPNSTNIVVSNMWCNGSHGISVGSLGQYAGETDIVENVYVSNITMRNAQNGARIKVFGGNPSPMVLMNDAELASTAGGGTGYVKNITFENFYVYNVDNPILIDQCYDTSASMCEEYPSNLTISDIHYINVTGTSSGEEGNVVVDLDCSDECEDITATGTHLSAPNGTATYICVNIASVSELDFNCSST